MTRLTHSADLFCQPFPSTSPQYEDLNLLASVDRTSSSHVTIAIDATTPTVVRDEQTRQRYGLPYSLPTISEAKKGENNTRGLSLISGSGLLFETREGQDPRLVCLEGEPDSPKAGFLFFSGGRSGQNPKITIASELQEEILSLVKREDNENFRPVTYADTDYQGRSGLVFKTNQINERAEDLIRAGIYARNIDSQLSHLAYFTEMPHEQGLYQTIRVIVNGALRESFRAIAIMESNTLELMRSVILPLNDGDIAHHFDGEAYRRVSETLTLTQLSRRRVRPQVNAYLQLVGSQSPKH